MSEQSTTAVLQPVLERFLAGDAAAKKELVELAYDRLLIIARKILRSFNSVDEETAAILNDCYRRIERALNDVKPATVRAFFGLVALQIRRELLDWVRRDKRSPDVLPLGGQKAGDASGGFEKDDSEFSTSQEGRETDIVEAVEKLPEAEREVVDMLFWMGLTQPEAAAIIGVHEDTVKRRWASARIKLQGFLKSYGPGT